MINKEWHHFKKMAHFLLLLFTPELKFIISRKNALWRIAQSTFNTTQIREYEIQNTRLVRNICDKIFGGKLTTLLPGHNFFWNYFTKIIKNKCRSIPALKVDGVTLITEQEKADGAMPVKFSMAHENTSQSPLNASVVDSCSVLYVNEFNVDPSALTSPKEVKKIIKKLKNGKAPGFDGVPNILLKNLLRRAVVYLTYVVNSCTRQNFCGCHLS
jgi:hypothetical protein